MIMVGICQWQNPTIDEDDEELQLFNQLTQFNWSLVYFQLFIHLTNEDELFNQLTQFNWSQVYFQLFNHLTNEDEDEDDDSYVVMKFIQSWSLVKKYI